MSSASSGGVGKILVIVFVIGLGIFAFVNYQQRMEYAKQLQNATVKDEGSSPQNIAVAKGIVEKVRKLYSIPADIEPTVAQIVDVNKLKEKNSFYNSAKNGDYLIVTSTRALLYDPAKNIILDVIPVQLQAPDIVVPQSSSKSAAQISSSVAKTVSSAATTASVSSK